MKVILILIIISSCSYVGFGMNKNQKRKMTFYQDLLLFCSGLKSDISFFNLKLQKIFQKAQMGYDKEFGSLCESAIKSINNGSSELICKEDILKISFLDENERQTLLNFFSILGKSDHINQSRQMEIYEKLFFDFFEKAKEEYKSKGTLCVKLGIYAGLFVAILFL